MARLSTVFGLAAAACGAAAETFAVATMAAYPGYAGSLAVSGTVIFGDNGETLEIRGALAGLEAAANGGLHVHTGTSCDTADGVGGRAGTRPGRGDAAATTRAVRGPRGRGDAAATTRDVSWAEAALPRSRMPCA